MLNTLTSSKRNKTVLNIHRVQLLQYSDDFILSRYTVPQYNVVMISFTFSGSLFILKHHSIFTGSVIFSNVPTTYNIAIVIMYFTFTTLMAATKRVTAHGKKSSSVNTDCG